MIKNRFTYSALLFLLASPLMVYGQDCGCSIEEVESNTVSPCDYTIGTVINVTSEDEFVAAVNEVNSDGGNATILIADGIYEIASVDWYPYITASNVVFRSLSGNRDAVILTGSGMADVSPGVEIGIYAVGDNITIADLTIRDLGNHGIAVTGDNLFVHNLKIQNTFEQMIKGNSGAEGIDNGIVQCSLFEYTAGIGPQWYIGGLDIHTGTNWFVRDNVFKNITSPSVAVAEHAVHFWDSSEDNIVERNMILNCDRGVGFGLGGSANDGGIIRNNMIYNNGDGLFADVGIGLETSPNTQVYNNSIYIEYDNAIEYRFAATFDVIITNNLTNKAIASRNDGVASLLTNYTEADPAWFEDLTAANLRLTSNIPLIVEMGTTLEDVEVDIDQTARPQMLNFDIGAFEFIHPVSIADEINIAPNINGYPNPATSTFTVNTTSTLFNQIHIYNAMGQVYYSTTFDQGVSTAAIATNDWPAGIYYCRITGENAVDQILKLVILEQ